MDDLRERIEAAHDRIGRLHCSSPERGAEWNALREMKVEYACLFGASRGWRLSRARWPVACGTFSPLRNTLHRRGDAWLQTFPFIDHPDWFRHPDRPYRPAAIVTHAYRGEDAIRAWAADVRLDCEILPWSWYYPGNTVAAVLTAPGR